MARGAVRVFSSRVLFVCFLRVFCSCVLFACCVRVFSSRVLFVCVVRVLCSCVLFACCVRVFSSRVVFVLWSCVVRVVGTRGRRVWSRLPPPPTTRTLTGPL